MKGEQLTQAEQQRDGGKLWPMYQEQQVAESGVKG